SSKMPRRRKEASSSGRGGGVREKPIQRGAANARERARMRILSRAFSRLKTTLPWVPADTKLSKLDTLRLATSYISHLSAVLHDDVPRSHTHPLTLTWPFSFSRSSDSDIRTTDPDTSEAPFPSHHFDPTIGPVHGSTVPYTQNRYYREDLIDYDYYPSDFVHIA
ncbi:unnamed protein product, partial [Meganyctiphanes norvegica]